MDQIIEGTDKHQNDNKNRLEERVKEVRDCKDEIEHLIKSDLLLKKFNLTILNIYFSVFEVAMLGNFRFKLKNYIYFQVLGKKSLI